MLSLSFAPATDLARICGTRKGAAMAADCRMNLRRVEKRDGLVFMMFLEQYGQRRVPCQYKSPGRLQEHQPTDPPDRDDP
jgi:hypothetical protein